MKLFLSLLLGLLLPGAAGADTWSGRVVGVHDGDTLTVLRGGWQSVKVRLADIDAPELGQPYGRASKQALSALCSGRTAVVQTQGEDKYGRTLARVSCSGAEANAEQLARGMAWFYVSHSRDEALRALEARARAGRVGLWADRNPTPPWDFRHADAGQGRGGGHGSGIARAPEPARPKVSGCGAKTRCGQMESCEEALYYLRRCGLSKLDKNRDGVPCEALCR
jgi:endonuclease YncB( thermonuclease family)